MFRNYAIVAEVVVELIHVLVKIQYTMKQLTAVKA